MNLNLMKKGFTLIEILIVLTLTVIILSVVVSSLYNLVGGQALDKDFSSVGALIEQAKSLTLNSKSASQYGVYFGTSTVTLFKGENYVLGSNTNQIYNLNGRTNISAVNLAGETTDRIYFERLTGYASASGTIALSLKKASTSPKVIQIYRTGVIEYK